MCRSREREERRFETRRERGRARERVAHTVQLCAVLERGGREITRRESEGESGPTLYSCVPF